MLFRIISFAMIAVMVSSCGIKGSLKRPSEIQREQEAKQKKARQ